MSMAEKSDKVPASSAKQVPQVVQSFAYSPKDAKPGEEMWITPTTPTSEVLKVPMSVLKEHAATGFIRFVDGPND
jgi:hypothetical protein